jgi:hypothetical protein
MQRVPKVFLLAAVACQLFIQQAAAHGGLQPLPTSSTPAQHQTTAPSLPAPSDVFVPVYVHRCAAGPSQPQLEGIPEQAE